MSASSGEPRSLERFRPPVRQWFEASFPAPTPAQALGWPPILERRSTLLLAPTGSGKTLAAFLAAIDRLMFSPEPPAAERLRVLYVSPLKALGVDIERNLRGPLAGIAEAARQTGAVHHPVTIAVRSGDTPPHERARFARRPSDILITTPESLYLVLTSRAREALAHVDTVIVDEIHTMVATKRGVHLFLSLERLEALRQAPAPLQRIGLSATLRPLDEAARLLGGGQVAPDGRWSPRPVDVVDAGARRPLELRVEVPVSDLRDLPHAPAHDASDSTVEARSIWPAIHPRLVELVRAHRTTMIFVNSRRLAERLAAALNETAGEELVLAHHGSVARDRRLTIERRLKQGEIRAIVATSSLELGIDMGAVDLVVQVEAPPSVASGMQRVGRAGHHVGAVSRGILMPKHRADLLATAAAAAQMQAAQVEAAVVPRNCLDVLAQQVVATVALDAVGVDELFDLARRSAPYADLPRDLFESVLDMLSGRYPSHEFAELRPRITWDRVGGRLQARRGAQRLSVLNGGTIPDRGLYGVFLSGTEESRTVRVGELDEEMVFESKPGDVFWLGASSWRIEQITYDRVEVSPAPGEPGRMPFWHGDVPGRAQELGRAIGALTRQLGRASDEDATRLLTQQHALDANAAANLLSYVREQLDATVEVPTDDCLVVERFTDELGDQRICLLSPFGARIHTPWSMVVADRLRQHVAGEVQSFCADDGMAFRVPATDRPLPTELLFPDPERVEEQLVEGLGATSRFAAGFRENAARALLLPRRRAGDRTPLWAQRKRSADLLRVASRYRGFPILLETYRECLRDVFDLPGLVELLRQVEARRIRVRVVDTTSPSPFARSLLFSYVLNFIYDGDAPTAERRALALSIDRTQLRELLGEAELRELLDAEVLADVVRSLQRLGPSVLRHPDDVHDLLLSHGDLTRAELEQRCASSAELAGWLDELERTGRVIAVTIASEQRFAAVEDAGRLAAALGTAIPDGVPTTLLEPGDDPLGDLVLRFARSHGPFVLADLEGRFALCAAELTPTLRRLSGHGALATGAFLPDGSGEEWCDPQVLRRLKRGSLLRLREQVQPVEPNAYVRFLSHWHSLHKPRTGPSALLEAVQQLQGAPLPVSALFEDILPARVESFSPLELDSLGATGAVVWQGVEQLGGTDGRVALFLADGATRLAGTSRPAPGRLPAAIRDLLERRGACFFHELQRAVGGFAPDLVDALWEMVWAGEITNDTLAPLRSRWLGASGRAGRSRGWPSARGGRAAAAGTEGRWSLWSRIASGIDDSETGRQLAVAETLLERYGVVTREALTAEAVPGGFSAVYPVLRQMEAAGRVRRGYFVAGLGAAQFAQPGADEALRAARQPAGEPRLLLLAATDPANPYGATLPWPEGAGRPQRAARTHVALLDGQLVAAIGRHASSLVTFLPETQAERSRAVRLLAEALAARVDGVRRRALLIAQVDGMPPAESALADEFRSAGFALTARGLLWRARRAQPIE